MVGATAMSMRQASIQSSAINDYLDQEIEFIAQVKSDPSKTSNGNYSFTARLQSFTVDGQPFHCGLPYES